MGGDRRTKDRQVRKQRAIHPLMPLHKGSRDDILEFWVLVPRVIILQIMSHSVCTDRTRRVNEPCRLEALDDRLAMYLLQIFSPKSWLT